MPSISVFLDIPKFADFWWKMLISVWLKRYATWFRYFFNLLWVRYNCAKFHHCRICATDFREGGLFAPLSIHKQPRKSRTWRGLSRLHILNFKLLFQLIFKSNSAETLMELRNFTSFFRLYLLLESYWYTKLLYVVIYFASKTLLSVRLWTNLHIYNYVFMIHGQYIHPYIHTYIHT